MSQDPIITVIIPGIPVPWQRAGKSGSRHYTPTASKHFKKSVALWGKLATNRVTAPKAHGPGEHVISQGTAWSRTAPLDFPVAFNLVVGGVFFVPTGKGAGRIRVGDVDNYLKAVLDGLNGIIYDDDRRVIGVRGLLLYKYLVAAGEHKPGAVIHFYEVGPPEWDQVPAGQQRLEEVRWTPKKSSGL